MTTFKIRDLMVSIRPADDLEHAAYDDLAGRMCPGGGITREPFAGGHGDPLAFARCPRQSCRGRSENCPPGTGCPGGGVSCQTGCSWLVTRTPAFDVCGQLSDLRNVCLYSQPPDIARLDQPQLVVLKEQLKDAMQQVEQREDALRRRGERAARPPETLAGVDALERNLTQAIEELRARRAEIEKNPAPKTEPRQTK